MLVVAWFMPEVSFCESELAVIDGLLVLPTKITVLKDVMLCDQVASHHCGESLPCIIC